VKAGAREREERERYGIAIEPSQCASSRDRNKEDGKLFVAEDVNRWSKRSNDGRR
jgi:hypothetical protein